MIDRDIDEKSLREESPSDISVFVFSTGPAASSQSRQRSTAQANGTKRNLRHHMHFRTEQDDNSTPLCHPRDVCFER